MVARLFILAQAPFYLILTIVVAATQGAGAALPPACAGLLFWLIGLSNWFNRLCDSGGV